MTRSDARPLNRKPATTTERVFYYQDLLGTVRAEVTQTGALVAGRAYDPWGLQLDGRLAAPTGASAREGYTSKFRLGETTADINARQRLNASATRPQ